MLALSQPIRGGRLVGVVRLRVNAMEYTTIALICGGSEKISKGSVLREDMPDNSLERAVWWTEYVLRHKGAPHLRTAAVDMPWYQFLLLDVIAFLLLTAITTSVVAPSCLFTVTANFLEEGEYTNMPDDTYHWAESSCHGSTSSLRAELGDGLFGEVSSLFGFLKLLLSLAELGEVQGCDLLLQNKIRLRHPLKNMIIVLTDKVQPGRPCESSLTSHVTHGFLNLPLVRLDLLLQFVYKVLHALVVLPVFFTLEAKLLDAPLGLAQVLLCIGVPPLFTVKLVLELAHALFQLLDGLLASLERSLAQLLLRLGMILLCSELVGQPGGVNHRLLRLLFGVLSLVQELVQRRSTLSRPVACLGLPVPGECETPPARSAERWRDARRFLEALWRHRGHAVPPRERSARPSAAAGSA
uniref:Uncharacterized protein n=1 Tax=Timema bartmani TaxID=61472 RepID=A0A7R9HY70_9NEOP|nr:unnamed protein product [Timema bartmani]